MTMSHTANVLSHRGASLLSIVRGIKKAIRDRRADFSKTMDCVGQ